MKKNILLAVGIITAAVLVSGCQGPAKTTLSPMKNVGPLTYFERRTVVTDGHTNSTTLDRMESPEAAQARLRERELKERGKKRSGGGYQYWWQTNPLLFQGGGYGGGGEPPPGYNYNF